MNTLTDDMWPLHSFKKEKYKLKTTTYYPMNEWIKKLMSSFPPGKSEDQNDISEVWEQCPGNIPHNTGLY